MHDLLLQHGHDKLTFLAEPEALFLMSVLFADHRVKHCRISPFHQILRQLFAGSNNTSHLPLYEQCPRGTLSLQKPDSNRHVTPYEGAASQSSHSAIVAGTGVEPAISGV